MAVDTNLPASGAIAAPPPGAPIETAAPVRSDAGSIVLFDRATGQPTGEVVSPAARAAENERALLPLTYGRPVDGSPAAPQSNVSGKTVGEIDPFYKGVNQRHAEQAAAAPAGNGAMPAASNTDSPSRGMPGTAPVPAARAKAPLQAAGGFGMGGATGVPEYFPMDGSEVRELTNELLDRLHARIENDLRFSLAICYPRIAVKLQLIVEAEAEVGGTGFTIEYVTAHDKTALEVARQHANSVVFVLREQRREFDDAGQSETPPDAMRDELGLDKPHRQLVQTGAGKQLSDRPLGW